ncbi:MAG: hypothetical protein A4E28_02669 [Methanocella sp. PtaU1.Bin125]|nr:MAG: hypothetical protein A4E28_02669 [Methanocella sp. PtaU1.Bin125]
MKWMALACIFLVLMVGIGEKTTHFSIKYSDSKAFTPGTGRALEDAYRAVDSTLGNLPKAIKVVVVDGDEMDNVGKHVEAFSAWNTQSSTIVLRGDTLKDKKSLGVVAKHEICHLALNDILEKKGKSNYAWMEEGICMVVSNEPLDDVKVAKYITSNGFMSPQEIAKAIDCKDYEVCKNGYLQSFSLCKKISQRYGMRTLVDVIKSPNPDFEVAFRQLTGQDFKRFYNEWRASVEADARGKASPRSLTIHGYLCLDEAC